MTPTMRNGMTTSLNATRRAHDLADARDNTVDLLVVGGGVTGAGAALDAASRGLSVCLVEAHDLAFGTSRWSSKLVHGGLRYLAKGDVGLAYESAAERGIADDRDRTTPDPAAATADSVAPATYPARHRPGHGRAGGRRRCCAGPPARRPRCCRRRGGCPRPKRWRWHPACAPDGLRGGLLSFDGQLVDDARLVVALARTAAGFGAKVLTRARVARAAPARRRRARRADRRRRSRSGPQAVVNAAGVWAGQLVDDVRLRPSRGTHLVLAADALDIRHTAITMPVPGETNRFVLLLPQDDGRALPRA